MLLFNGYGNKIIGTHYLTYSNYKETTQVADDISIPESTCKETADFSVLFEQKINGLNDEPPYKGVDTNTLKADCGCGHPHCNGKDKHLHNGLKRISEVVDERHKVFDKSVKTVGTITKAAFGTGIFLATVGCPPIGLGIAAIAGLVGLGNKATERKTEKRFEEVNAALHTCEVTDATFEDKRNAYGILKKAGKHVRYWENSEYVASTVVKFVVGEVALAMDVIFAFFDAKGELEKRSHPPKTGAGKFAGALGELHKGLDLNALAAAHTEAIESAKTTEIPQPN